MITCREKDMQRRTVAYMEKKANEADKAFSVAHPEIYAAWNEMIESADPEQVPLTLPSTLIKTVEEFTAFELYLMNNWGANILVYGKTSNRGGSIADWFCRLEVKKGIQIDLHVHPLVYIFPMQLTKRMEDDIIRETGLKKVEVKNKDAMPEIRHVKTPADFIALLQRMAEVGEEGVNIQVKTSDKHCANPYCEAHGKPVEEEDEKENMSDNEDNASTTGVVNGEEVA